MIISLVQIYELTGFSVQLDLLLNFIKNLSESARNI